MKFTQLRALMACSMALSGFVRMSMAQEVLLQEGFNDDGSASNPPRYTVTGGFKSEPPHSVDDVSSASDQTGPVYWARNTDVSFVGVPAPTAGRRAILVWDGAIASGEASPDMMKLIANTVKWLAKDKANATVLVSPNVAAAQGLADDLTASGYSVADDDPSIAEDALVADALIKAPGGNPSRFANSPQGVLTFSASDLDDMLLSSIGTTATFTADRPPLRLPPIPLRRESRGRSRWRPMTAPGI